MKDVCVVIPIYQEYLSEKEKISLNRSLKIFSKREIFLICPIKLVNFVKLLCNDNSNISVAPFENRFFKNINGYNKLLMSDTFYNYFSDFEYILINQLDVFVIKDELNYWLTQKYDNLGAPIFEGYAKDKTNRIKEKGSNGGFSLRKTESCLKALSQIGNRYSNLNVLWKMEVIWYWKLYRIIRDGLIFNYKCRYFSPRLNEDMFWSVIIPDKFKWFNVCPPSKAKYFAFEVNPQKLFSLTNFNYPMAIHAWWKYDQAFALELIKEINKKEKPDSYPEILN